jgi:hypothetical protein
MTSPSNFKFSAIAAFTAGILFTSLIGYAYLFNFDFDKYMLYRDVIANMEIYTKKFDATILRKDSNINNLLLSKLNAIEDSAESVYLPKPIPDDLFRIYQYSLDSFADLHVIQENRTMNHGRQSHWIYLPLNEILAYASYLKVRRFNGEMADGITIYMGLVDSSKIAKNIIDRNRIYFKAKQGAIIPMFVATKEVNTNGGFSLEPIPSILATDCNCGNPPNCNSGKPPTQLCASGTKDSCGQLCPKPQPKREGNILNHIY